MRVEKWADLKRGRVRKLERVVQALASTARPSPHEVKGSYPLALFATRKKSGPNTAL